MTSDFPTDRDPVYGWEAVHSPGHRCYKSPQCQLYADLSKLYYDRASILADIPGRQASVDKCNALGVKYYRLSVGLPAEKTEFDMTGRKNE
jgi:hypothetical protein